MAPKACQLLEVASVAELPAMRRLNRAREIDRIVFLGAAPNLSAEKLKSRPYSLLRAMTATLLAYGFRASVPSTKKLLNRKN